jgi:outer membrane protein TolC
VAFGTVKMGKLRATLRAAATCVAILLAFARAAHTQEPWHFILPEQRHIEIRDPSRLPKARLPDIPPPPTVADPQLGTPPLALSLDDAIRIALANSQVIRVLAGDTAVASGSTIYDPAVTNTQIDQARARFDPIVQSQHQFSRAEIPQAVFNPASPSLVSIIGPRVDTYAMTTGVSKTTVTGGTASLGVTATPTREALSGLPLNPETPSSVDLAYTQPLLQGGGVQVNVAPIVIARINTERSFFQMKGSSQQLVGSVVQGYWAIVSARVDVWARQQQVDQAGKAYREAKAKFDVGFNKNAGDLAQTRAAWENFKANLITAQAVLLSREEALRNLLGLPPSHPLCTARLVPITPPVDFRLDPQWCGIVRLAEEHRPDLIELKLIIEADQQQLLIARNQALPRLDANGLYRWNGLEGYTPDRTFLSNGDFYQWQLGVNFSVPLGLRDGRAKMRQQELIITRDRANLDQGLHSAIHALAGNCRNLAQFYQQYEAYKQSELANRVNYNQQWADFSTGRLPYLNVLQALTDWGNAVEAKALSLAQYNTELANLEQQTGTILETHGVRFAEERYGSIGPLGRLFADRCYPQDMPPGPNADRYQNSRGPAEDFFDLRNPAVPPPRVSAPPPEPIPPPRPR